MAVARPGGQARPTSFWTMKAARTRPVARENRSHIMGEATL